MPGFEEFAGAEAGARQFETTHWSVVQRAGDSQAPESAAALEKLCRAYWYPVYAFVRASGYGPEDSSDVTQEFFLQLLERKWLARADPDRGRFRNFLLASVKNLLANQWKREHTVKRGSGQILPFDAMNPEERYRLEPRDYTTPELLFERRWAAALLARVLERLRAECDGEGRERARRFEVLKVFLLEDKGTVSLADAAAQLGLSVIATKGVVHRLRNRYREIFREEIANTVARPEDVEDEIRHLFRALAQ